MRLEVETILELSNLAHSFAKFYSRKFQSPYFASDLQIFGHKNFSTYGIYICLHIQYESGLCGIGSCSYGRRESVCRTSILVVKAFKDFVKQMSDYDDLLQSVCWTVSCVAFATDG